MSSKTEKTETLQVEDAQSKSQAQAHLPVMLAEVMSAFEPCSPSGYYLDATWGRGGYCEAILTSKPAARVVAFDKDPAAAALAGKQADAYDGRLRFIQACFSDIRSKLQDEKLQDEKLQADGFTDLSDADTGDGKFCGIVFDLGLSTPQLLSNRGFSFANADDFLDMRFAGDGVTAADWLATSSEAEIGETLRNYGEEPAYKKIAADIVKQRKLAAITKVGQLVEIVSRHARRKSKRFIHPATRSFMAIRIRINRELEVLSSALSQALALLAVGGRLAVVSFHSLEDRIVKRAFAAIARPPARASRHVPQLPQLPQLDQQAQASKRRFRLVLPAPIKPSAIEIKANPKARSAKLRVIEKIAAYEASAASAGAS